MEIGAVLAKFSVNRHETLRWANDQTQTSVVMNAVDASEIPEDARFARSTPYGELKMAVDNPAALAMLTPGKRFYLQLLPVE